MFDCVKPWQTTSGIFLLYDFVHILKAVRNNWIAEKCKKLSFEDDGKIKHASWAHIIDLYRHEQEHLVKLSKLTNVSVFSRPIERQKVSTCLKIFCDETITALKTHTCVKEADDTIRFLEIFVKFWKIVNVRVPYLDQRYRDPAKAVISSPDNERLLFLLQLGVMAEQMTAKQGKRHCQLTRDTGNALSHTCQGLVSLSKLLLKQSSFSYVLLGSFTTDPLEKMFGKLRQGSGGTYFINVQQVIEKVKIQRAKLSLQIGIDINSLSAESGHNCEKCGYLLDENACDVFDNLPELENNLRRDVKA